ncbi:hypothetical protein TNCV_3929391 [Trichonephila clavipes]|nr:hypothetical protein TNCV_3929391 [Trichonephila clavipes]
MEIMIEYWVAIIETLRKHWARMFNGTKSLLYFMSALGLSLGTAAHAERVTISDVREHGSTQEATTKPAGLIRRYLTAEGSFYDPGIHETVLAIADNSLICRSSISSHWYGVVVWRGDASCSVILVT